MLIVIGGIIIPIIASLVLFFKFRKEAAWWEYLLPIAVSLFLTIILKFVIGFGQFTDTEYWTSYAKKVEYIEKWNELVPHIRTSTDADGNMHVETYTTVDSHGPYWYMYDSLEDKSRISKPEYEKIKTSWKNSTFKDMHRNYHSKDGDMYFSTYPNDESRMVVITNTHYYKNKVAASDSVFNFEEVDTKEWNLFDYPKIDGIDDPSILSEFSVGLNMQHRLNVFNAKYGSLKEIKVWILVWNGDETLDTGYAQENYWKGGNKNELVICIGTDDDKNITWSHVFSWTEKENMKVGLRNHINKDIGKQLFLGDTIGWLENNVQLWERKSFAEFNYITVPLPNRAVILIYVLSALAAVFVVWFAATNECNENDPKGLLSSSVSTSSRFRVRRY